MHEPAFDLHNPIDSRDVDTFPASSVQGPINGSHAGLGLRHGVDDGSYLAYNALIELLATPFLGLAIKGGPGHLQPIAKRSHPVQPTRYFF